MSVSGIKRRNGSAPPIKRVAYERFQQALLTGRVRPGHVVSQRDLVEMLGLSIGVLRELLPRLEAEGLVTVMPQRGIQITSVDLPMIRDAYQMRLALEREATMHAVDRMPEEMIQEQKRLHVDILDRLPQEFSPDFLAEAGDIDSNFHATLIEFTGNDLLIQAYASNSIRVGLIKREPMPLNAAGLAAAFADHMAVIDALLRRDRWQAANAMETHIRNSRDRALTL